MKTHILPFLFLTTLLTIFLYSCDKPQKTVEFEGLPANLFEHSALQPRWSSPENINGVKGSGGMENNGAKGSPSVPIEPGGYFDLLDVKGTGIITRMWITISDRSPEMLRSLKLEMFWDDAEKPAVSVPFGDFFGLGLGKTARYENALFANPEGRSFNCFIPMPFQTGARIRITNESGKRLNAMFFDVDYQLIPAWNDNFLYFHACWRRDTATTLAKDFALLPKVKGKGRFLGVNIGINTKENYHDSWWGEGEVKIYLDGDTDNATLVGTGTEDYIGTAWGQGKFITQYTGCLIAGDPERQWAFYRFHLPDPVYFDSDCRVTIQQIGGSGLDVVREFQNNDVPLIPVTISGQKMTNLYVADSVVDLNTPDLPVGWTNFYRKDDISATAYFYLDTPANQLPGMDDKSIRTYKLSRVEP